MMKMQAYVYKLQIVKKLLKTLTLIRKYPQIVLIQSCSNQDSLGMMGPQQEREKSVEAFSPKSSNLGESTDFADRGFIKPWYFREKWGH